MDYRWVFTALFVAAVTGSFLPGITEAQNTTAVNSTASANATSASANATSASGNATSASGNATSASSNATSASSNATSASGNTTSASTNATSAPAPANSTSVSANATATTTTAPPLAFNDTVTTLNTNISNAECRKKQLCAAKPDGCDPSTTGSCYFLSAEPQSGLNYIFGLSGISKGYIAAILATTASPGNNESAYICANNNGKVKFFSTRLQSDGTLVKQPLNVNSVKGSVDGDKIQCSFMATVPASAARATATSLSMGVANGTYNSANDDLGPATSQFRTAPVDLSNPNATVTYTNSTTANTTASPSTTNHAIALHQSLMQALLITVIVLGLAIL